jgi:hypothetical protein
MQVCRGNLIHGFRSKIAPLVFGLCLFFLLETPARADFPIFWGATGADAPLWIGLSLRGIGFVVVILVEALVFKYFFKVDMWPALKASFLINLYSSLLGFVAGIPFATGGMVAFFVMPVLIFVAYKSMTKQKLPEGLRIAIIVCAIAGTLGGFMSIQGPPMTHLRVFMGLLLPLVLGFSVTMYLEMGIGKRFFRGENYWKGILYANLWSYLFLLLTMPFWPVSLFKDAEYTFPAKLQQMIDSGTTKDETSITLVQLSATNRFLLGLSNDATPREGYHPDSEINYLTHAVDSSNNRLLMKPDYTLMVIDRCLAFNTLKPEEKESLEWYRDLFEAYIPLKDAMDRKDQSTFNILYPAWERIQGKRPFQEKEDSYNSGYLRMSVSWDIDESMLAEYNKTDPRARITESPEQLTK